MNTVDFYHDRSLKFFFVSASSIFFFGSWQNSQKWQWLKYDEYSFHWKAVFHWRQRSIINLILFFIFYNFKKKSYQNLCSSIIKNLQHQQILNKLIHRNFKTNSISFCKSYGNLGAISMYLFFFDGDIILEKLQI